MFLKSKKIKDFATAADEEIIRQYPINHDPGLASELFNRYTHLVFGVCMKYLQDEEEAKDAVMVVFEQVLAQEPKEVINNFKGWLFTVTKNHCLMQLRHNKAGERVKDYKLRELESELMELPAVMHLYEEEEKVKQSEKLHLAMNKLGHDQRTCVELFYFEDKSYKEIVEMTGFDLNAVKSHIQNGKRNLKILLDHGKET